MRDKNPTITGLEVEYNIELRGGEYDGFKFHVLHEPPWEMVLRDMKIRDGMEIGTTEYCYRQVGIFINRCPGPDEKPEGIEWDAGLVDDLDHLPCNHIHTLLPLPVLELREVYPEVLIWHGREEYGVVCLHVPYDLMPTNKEED